MKDKLLLLISLFIFACSSEQENETSISYDWAIISVKTNDKGLAIDDVPYLQHKKEKEYYVNYNNITHTLNFYNLETKTYEKQIQFYKSGVNQIQGINEYAICGDTIILYSNLALRYFDEKGKLIKALSLNELCPELAENYKLEKKGITIDNLLELTINQQENNLILRTYKKTLMPYDDSFYKDSYFCEFNLNTNKGLAIPIVIPKELNGKYYYADLATPHVIGNNNLLIYHFHFKSSIYIYNTIDKQTKKIKFKATHIQNKTIGIKRSKAENKINMISSIFFQPKFYNLKYDPWKNLYYLLYAEKIDIDNIEYSGSIKYLLVFNNKFEKLGEVDIDPFLSSKFVVSKNGLLFRNTKDDSYNELKLYSLSVNTVN